VNKLTTLLAPVIASLGLTAAAVLPAVPAQAATRCTTGQLALTVDPNPGGGYAGGYYYYLDWRNKGTTACYLGGFPGVTALGSAFRQLGNPAGRSGTPWTAQTFRPGQTRRSLLQVADVGVWGPAKCTYAAAFYVRAIPPAGYNGVLAPFRFTVCRNGGPTAPTPMTTGPIIP
jgi:uncharacterized protein DUF4232